MTVSGPKLITCIYTCYGNMSFPCIVNLRFTMTKPQLWPRYIFITCIASDTQSLSFTVQFDLNGCMNEITFNAVQGWESNKTQKFYKNSTSRVAAFNSVYGYLICIH